MNHKYFILHINPEPWAIGEVSRTKHGARISPNPNLAAFQNAVREELSEAKMLPDDFRKLTFYFWRQQARYIDTKDRIRQRNQADATNMQKALEDALQGVLFKNDREVRDVRSVIVDQGPHVKEPGIIIRADRVYESDYANSITQEIPKHYLNMLFDRTEPQETDDKWETAEELF